MKLLRDFAYGFGGCFATLSLVALSVVLVGYGIIWASDKVQEYGPQLQGWFSIQSLPIQLAIVFAFKALLVGVLVAWANRNDES